MTDQLKGLLLQAPVWHSNMEISACRLAGLLSYIPVVNTTIDQLAEHRDKLIGGFMPVGSVEFVRKAMAVAGYSEPILNGYPTELRDMLKRRVWRSTGLPASKVFIKPADVCKLFTGFVYDPEASALAYSEHDQEQLHILQGLPTDTRYWLSEPVTWLSEWRYYIQDSKVIGQGRYDADGADDAPAPDLNVLEACVARMGPQRSMAIDLGVLANGETALVEVNDAWAIGLYGRGMSDREYLNFLATRWVQIATPSTE